MLLLLVSSCSCCSCSRPLRLLPPTFSSRESLIFSTGVKRDLMAAITVSLTLARKQVDPKQVGLNRVALLHGPPGTGADIGVTIT